MQMRAMPVTSPLAGKAVAEAWASVDEVAAHLGVRKDSIYRWIENRGLPARKVGKLWKMKLSEVDTWVRSLESVPEPASAASSLEQVRQVQQTKGGGRTVLVVDDEKWVRDTIGEFLEDEGYKVLFASDGVEALEVLASASPRPSLIILDLKMPNLDGREFREQQARDAASAWIPVIVVTAERTAKLGGAIVLRKPLHVDQLARAIDKVLKGA